MKNKVLDVKNLTMKFGGLTAVDQLSFDVYEQEIVGIIGPNGAGKTTVFNCITQFYKDDEGEILFRDHDGTMIDLNKYDVTDVINKGLVRTFQNVELVKDLSIIDNVLIGAHNQFKTTVFSHIFCFKTVKQEELKLREKAMKILDSLGIKHLMNQFAYGQPYGVLKKIEIARTLISDPKVIILDEPAAGLNDVETEELRSIIYNIRDEYGCAIVLIEHDMRFVMDICDRICAINFGKLLALDTPINIQKHPKVQEAYLGGVVSE
jgi:branched-chain amino acid transport system ATP-binding protein